MITKESRSVAIKSLRQEQSLRHRDDTAEVMYVLNPKFPDLIPPVAWPSQVVSLHPIWSAIAKCARMTLSLGTFGPDEACEAE